MTRLVVDLSDRRPHRRWWAMLLLVAWLGAADPAQAHRLLADYAVSGSSLRIEFFFADGRPASDLQVTATQDQGDPILIGTTDQEGSIQFKPPSRGKWIIVGQGAGHSNARFPLEIPAEIVRATLDAGSQPSVTEDSRAHSENGAPPDTQRALDTQPFEPAGRNRRTVSTPWLEIGISLAFILLLTLATLWMMRRSEKASLAGSELRRLRDDLLTMQTQVDDLKRQLQSTGRQTSSGKSDENA